MVLLNVIADAKPQKLLLLQPSVRKIFHVFQTGSGVGESCLPDQLVQVVVLSGIPFRIHQKTYPVLKGHILELCVRKLVF